MEFIDRLRDSEQVQWLLSDPTMLFWSAIALLVVFVLLLRQMLRRRKAVEQEIDDTSDTLMLADADAPVDIDSPVVDSGADVDTDAFTILRRSDDDTSSGDISGDDTPTEPPETDIDDTKAPETDPDAGGLKASANAVANVKRLESIEQEMLALRELFQSGQIDRSVYVLETRSLYDEAKALTQE